MVLVGHRLARLPEQHRNCPRPSLKQKLLVIVSTILKQDEIFYIFAVMSLSWFEENRVTCRAIFFYFGVFVLTGSSDAWAVARTVSDF